LLYYERHPSVTLQFPRKFLVKTLEATPFTQPIENKGKNKNPEVA
jgi:hypothetical protein